MSTTPRRGFILLFAIVVGAALFAVTTALIGSVSASVRLERHRHHATDALMLAEAGLEKAVYELNQSPSYLGENDTPLGNGTFSVSVSVVNPSTKRLTSTGYIPNDTNPVAQKTVTATVSVDSTIISFHYGVQVGAGGLIMDNGSTVEGNVYSNGPISGSGSVVGDATAAGLSSITGITVLEDARARSMSGCVVTGNAYYYQTNTCTVAGTRHANSPDADILPLPISDAQIEDWKAAAEAGGVIPGPYTLTGDQTLGPVKIAGDLTIGNGAKLRMAGPIWVEGNVSFNNNSHFLVSGSMGGQSVALIAHVAGQESTKGAVDLSNNVTIAGNGNPDSYPLAVSMKHGSSAIIMSNNATSVLLYAPYGTIEIRNNASANQVTGHTIHLRNQSTIVYLSGLQNANFSSGPGGSWAINKGTYVIVP